MESSTSSPSREAKAEEIVFFDLETNVPRRTGKLFWVLEFGAIVVCPRKLVELESYTTLIRPKDMSVVGLRSSRPDGITRGKVALAPTFEEVAGEIFEVLNGRVWAGHNILRFDCVRIKEAFARIGRPSPEPVGLIDSLGLLGHKFGRRAGNMKMATLADYFGLGQQKHRSLDDVRMNLDVLKHCATVLFLEASFPSDLKGNLCKASSTIMTRSRSNGFEKLASSNSTQFSCKNQDIIKSRKSPPKTTLSIGYQRSVPYATRSSKVRESVKRVLCKANGNQPLMNRIIKHSRSLLR